MNLLKTWIIRPNAFNLVKSQFLSNFKVNSFSAQNKCNNSGITLYTDGQPLLASGGSSGVISVWNLEKKRIHSVIKEAHDSSIISLHFFANEPVLLSASVDNSIKVSCYVLATLMTIYTLF